MKIAFAAAMLAGVASAATTIIDFETDAERRAAPRLNRATYRFGVTNMCATGGETAFRLAANPWKAGDYDWPAFTLKIPKNDWSGYDRFVFDVTNLGDDGDTLGLSIAGPTGKVDNVGLNRSMAVPAWSSVQWVVDLRYWPNTTSPTNIARMHIYSHRPQSLNVFFDRFTLLKPGEPLPPAPKFDARSAAALRAGRAEYDAERSARRRAFLASLEKENLEAGLRPDGFLVGQASSMDGVRPRDTFAAKGPKNLSLRLARNESEALQILVTPTGGDLEGVCVKVSPLKLKVPFWKRMSKGTYLPAEAVKVSVVGYVETTTRPRYPVGYNVATNEPPGYRRLAKRAPLGWWPDPLLDFLGCADVRKDDVQSFWVGVHAPADAVPGVYEGRIVVSASGRRAATLPFAVRIDGFEIPKLPPYPIVVSFNPCVYVRPDQHGARDRDMREQAAAKPDSPVNMWKTRRFEWGDFLADHFITMAPLYQHGGELPYDVWDRLKAQGRMGWYNVAYFSAQSLDTPERKGAWARWANWVAGVVSNRLEEAKAHGLEDNCLFYCCDETSPKWFKEVDAMVNHMKRRFPKLPIATTSYDNDYGLGEHLRNVDIFIPQTIRFDLEKAEKSRSAGHKVWWYYACDQKAPLANTFTECQPMEQRLLMGAMSAKWRPDGFLYYQMAYFNSLDCITSGPYTAWSPRSWWNEHGDASWVAVGPEGRPLSTLRFENFRDGVEDMWYAELLRRKLNSNPSAPWAERAKELLAVPRSVVDTLANYTDDAGALYAWRNAIADLLETSR